MPCIFSQEAELSSKPDEILESTVDAAEWNLELERVLPQLKVTIRTDNKVHPYLDITDLWRLQTVDWLSTILLNIDVMLVV